MENTIKKVDNALNGDEEDLDEIKEEYSDWFGDHDEKEALNLVKDYLEGEIRNTKKNWSDGLHKALDELNVTSDSKKDKTNETSLGSPIDYVVDKKSNEPYDFTDDQE
jgi:hypothetical protein